jgi:hypothetical protein
MMMKDEGEMKKLLGQGGENEDNPDDYVDAVVIDGI